jgi:hypothetical protein
MSLTLRLPWSKVFVASRLLPLRPIMSEATRRASPPLKRIKVEMEDDGTSAVTAGPKPAPARQPKPKRENGKKKGKAPKPGGHEEVIEFEIVDLLGEDRVAQLKSEGKDRIAKFGKFEEVELEVEMLGAHGVPVPLLCSQRD